MKKVLTLLMAMLIATSATAIIAPTPDLMGFYFDDDANYPCLENVAPYSQTPMYLVISNLTSDALYGFEFGYDITGQGLVVSTLFANSSIIDVGTGPGNHIVGFGEPTPATPVTLLATLTVLNLDSEPLYFLLHGSTPSSIDPQYPVILLADGVLQSVPVVIYYYDISSVINGMCTSATDHVSFDSMKSLYR